MNDVLLRALLREKTDYTPIWLMRQAGRYLPEYQLTRKKAGSFMALCKNPRLATEVTLQPLERFSLDGTILFSDILTIPDAMGLELTFTDGEGPKLLRPVRCEQDINRLVPPHPEDDLSYVLEAVAEIRRALNNRVPLIGFSGSPFTLACYMVEGQGSHDYKLTRTMMYSRPDLFSLLLETLTTAVIDYLNAQIEAGAQAVMIFDSWGGILTHSAYHQFSLPYLQRIALSLTKVSNGCRVPSIVFTKGGGLWLDALAGIGADAIGLDWVSDIGIARQRVGDRVALQGNLDPLVLLSNPMAIEREAQKIIDSFGSFPGHVFNLGHGILKETPVEHVSVLVDFVRNYSHA